MRRLLTLHVLQSEDKEEKFPILLLAPDVLGLSFDGIVNDDQTYTVAKRILFLLSDKLKR